MNNLHGNRLKKNPKIFQENLEDKTKKLFALRHYINNGKKQNTYSGYNQTEINKRDANTNSLINSYNENFGNYLSNKKFVNYKIKNKCNNHSLYDSNQQKLINFENAYNFVKFNSNNKNNSNISNQNFSNKEHLYNIKNIEPYNIKPNYIDEYNKKNKYDDKYETKINNLRNNNRKNERNKNSFNINYLDSSNNKIINTNYYINGIRDKSFDISKHRYNFKCNCNKKFTSIKNRNKNYNLSKNNTDITSNNDNSPTKIPNKTTENYNIKRNMTEKNSLEKIKKNFANSNFIKNLDKDKEIRQPSDIKTKIYNSPDNYNKRNVNFLFEKNIKKTTTNINEDKIKSIIPIKLNIEYTNKEKLSKLKKIIENSSKNHNFYQIDLSKNTKNKSVDKAIKQEKENNQNKFIFKKKKINMILKVENKGKEVNNIHYENNFLVTSPINKKKIIKSNLSNININNSTNKIKDNNQIQSLVASYNLYINKEDNRAQKSNENKLSSKETEQTSYLNNKESLTFKKAKAYMKKNIDFINNEDTITLSYSKESFTSKKKANENKNICLPFLVERFSLLYNKYNKKLIINDKNESDKTKKGYINIDSDDEYYQLTKEIILLKKGLAKKSELSNEMKKKIRELKPERVYKLCLFGNRRIYKKKTNNYKNYIF